MQNDDDATPPYLFVSDLEGEISPEQLIALELSNNPLFRGNPAVIALLTAVHDRMRPAERDAAGWIADFRNRPDRRPAPADTENTPADPRPHLDVLVARVESLSRLLGERLEEMDETVGRVERVEIHQANVAAEQRLLARQQLVTATLHESVEARHRADAELVPYYRAGERIPGIPSPTPQEEQVLSGRPPSYAALSDPAPQLAALPLDFSLPPRDQPDGLPRFPEDQPNAPSENEHSSSNGGRLQRSPTPADAPVLSKPPSRPSRIRLAMSRRIPLPTTIGKRMPLHRKILRRWLSKVV